jgi:ferredoxin
MKININKEKCIGCGYCASVCPEVFELGEDGKSRVKEGVNFSDFEDQIKEAKEGCPVGAIEIQE